jgi:hypothetical protein
MDQNNGGIIGKINTPTTSVASGVWSLQDQFESQSSSIWPLAFPQITIANSCRFNGSSDTLTRTPSSETNRKTFTISSWVKFSATESMLFSVGADTNNRSYIILTSDNIVIENRDSGTKNVNLITNRKFRDYSAWYHILLSVDTTQSTASDRVKLYVNGVQETSFSTETYPSQNQDFDFNTASIHYIGRNAWSSGNFMNGYLAEVVMIDGQQLLPTSFGVFNTVSNIWEPRGYAGTYGTNGFRLDFANSSALGNDVSGNDNDFTVNNLTSIDQSTDTCSNNFATANPLIGNANVEYSDGNLNSYHTYSGQWRSTISTIGASSGKWYAEYKISAVGTEVSVGICDVTTITQTSANDFIGEFTDSVGYVNSGSIYKANSVAQGSLTTYTANDIIGIAMDLDNNTIQFYKNGSTIGTTTSLTANKTYAFGTAGYGDARILWNIGSPSFSISSGNADANGFGNFEYAVPSGYFALNTKNLAEFG